MNRTTKLINHPLFQAFIGDRGLRVYSKAVNGRLGMPGLKKLVLEKTGQEPDPSEAYCFYVRNKEVIKILVKEDNSTSMMEFYNGAAKQMKEVLVELGLL